MTAQEQPGWDLSPCPREVMLDLIPHVRHFWDFLLVETLSLVKSECVQEREEAEDRGRERKAC